jgi:hypothetical protein
MVEMPRFSDQLIGCVNFSTASVTRSVIGAMVLREPYRFIGELLVSAKAV